MTRGGSKKHMAEERRCLINGSGQSRHEMIRFVLDLESNVTPDVAERLGGRGVWVRATRADLEAAVAKNHFARGFKTPCKIPGGLVDMVEGLLRDRLISQLAMARKSGDAIAGADKVKEAIQSGGIEVMLQASDGSSREKRNIGGKDQVRWHFETLTRAELGMAFGREYVVHAAVSGDGLAKRISYEANRLSGIREIDFPDANELDDDFDDGINGYDDIEDDSDE